jgi:hypothetical protein
MNDQEGDDKQVEQRFERLVKRLGDDASRVAQRGGRSRPPREAGEGYSFSRQVRQCREALSAA